MSNKTFLPRAAQNFIKKEFGLAFDGRTRTDGYRYTGRASYMTATVDINADGLSTSVRLPDGDTIASHGRLFLNDEARSFLSIMAAISDGLSAGITHPLLPTLVDTRYTNRFDDELLRQARRRGIVAIDAARDAYVRKVGGRYNLYILPAGFFSSPPTDARRRNDALADLLFTEIAPVTSVEINAADLQAAIIEGNTIIKNSCFGKWPALWIK